MAPWAVGCSTEEMEVQVFHWANLIAFILDRMLLTFTTCTELVERMLQAKSQFYYNSRDSSDGSTLGKGEEEWEHGCQSCCVGGEVMANHGQMLGTANHDFPLPHFDPLLLL